MKTLIKILSFLITALLCISTSLNAQEQAAFYYFEGADVVFQFNGDAYLKTFEDQEGEKMAFGDLDINDVLVSSDLDTWSKDDWSMKKVGPNVFQLRKKIKSFGNGFSWNFKFLVNQKYWIEPDADNTLFTDPDDVLESVFGLNPYEELINENGNAAFYLNGFTDAQQVILTGNFIEWDERKIDMKRVNGGWKINLELPLGRYEYKFIVDGEWHHDVANDHRLRNEHGTYNSVLTLQKESTFNLPGFADAKRVFIAGTFNHWKIKKDALRQGPDGWTTIIPLYSGKHFYKFIVDGEWMIDPNNPISESDVEGNINSVLFVN